MTVRNITNILLIIVTLFTILVCCAKRMLTGRFRPGLTQVYQRYPQMTADGFMYMRVDVRTTTYVRRRSILKATLWIFASPVTSYQAAQSLCETNGGKLATMEDGVEQSRVANTVVNLHGFRLDSGAPVNKLANNLLLKQVNLWIGYRKPSGSNAWVDALGRSDSSWPYEQWWKDEPKPDSGEECAVMQVNFANPYNEGMMLLNFGWYSDKCDVGDARLRIGGVLCRFPVSVAPLGTQQPVWNDDSKNLLPTVKGKTSKGDPYIEVALLSPASDKGIFLLVRTNVALTQKDAQAYCKQIGGHGQLASVHSKQALAYLQASFFASVGFDWIWSLDWAWSGLHKDGPGKPLQWFDGTKVDYVKWAYGSPGDADTLEVALSLSAIYTDS